MKQADLLLGGVALGGVGAVAAALVTQYGFGMQPCAWCVLQRAIFLGASLAAVIGLVLRWAPGRRLSALLVAALALCGVAAALWQHFVAAAAASCDLSLAERIVAALGLDERFPEVFTAYASCADAAVKLFGVAYEFWSLSLFLLMLAAAARVWLRPRL
jgi:protein dithiol:quinone oxidoreductase